MREVSKEAFREAYFRYGRGLDGWTQDYWIRVHEQGDADRGMRYCIEDPVSPEQTRMMIVTDHGAREHRLFLVSPDAEDRLFGP
jgi:hypothetical protein